MVKHGIYLFYLGLFVLLYICVLNKIKSIASFFKTTIKACQILINIVIVA
jgi:uncharacterized membrane protein